MKIKIMMLCLKSLLILNLCNLFLELYRAFPEYYESSINSSKSKVIDKSPMQNALQYLESNYSDEISLESMAKRIGLSEYYFSRLFKETTGMNFGVYLSYLRIQNAKRDIGFTDKSIIDIAYECGFKSIRTFNRNFIRFCEVTPTEYRDIRK